MLVTVLTIISVAAILAIFNMDSPKKAVLFLLLVFAINGFVMLCIYYPGYTATLVAALIFAGISFGRSR